VNTDPKLFKDNLSFPYQNFLIQVVFQVSEIFFFLIWGYWHWLYQWSIPNQKLHNRKWPKIQSHWIEWELKVWDFRAFWILDFRMGMLGCTRMAGIASWGQAGISAYLVTTAGTQRGQEQQNPVIKEHQGPAKKRSTVLGRGSRGTHTASQHEPGGLCGVSGVEEIVPLGPFRRHSQQTRVRGCHNGTNFMVHWGKTTLRLLQ
jgi:hypothetical protein